MRTYLLGKHAHRIWLHHKREVISKVATQSDYRTYEDGVSGVEVAGTYMWFYYDQQGVVRMAVASESPQIREVA